MRVHIVIDDEVVERIDRLAGDRGRSAWIVKTLTDRLDTEERWQRILDGIGCIPDTGHEWDDDPAEWVRRQRAEWPERGVHDAGAS